MAVKSRDLFPLLARVDNDNAAGEYYLVDIVNIATQDGRHCYVVKTDPYDVTGINSRGELAAMEAEWQARRRVQAMADGATLIAPETVWFAWDTKLGRDVLIEPNVFFGPGVSVATMSKSARTAISRARKSPAAAKSAPSPDSAPERCWKKKPRSAISSKPRKRIWARARRPTT